MDEQTRIARFESMRKNPGARGVKTSRNKKLFLKHKELEKGCEVEIKRHEFDAKIASVEIKQRQLLVEKKQEQLRSEQSRCERRRERTQLCLDAQERRHVASETRCGTLDAEVRVEDIEKAVEEFKMPPHMRRKLVEVLYTSQQALT